MSRIPARPIFSQVTLARLAYDEPVSAHDDETGIVFEYRVDPSLGGRLQLSGGLLRDDTLSVGCEPDEINLIATILLAGLKMQLS